jgi:hypothetical protein
MPCYVEAWQRRSLMVMSDDGKTQKDAQGDFDGCLGFKIHNKYTEFCYKMFSILRKVKHFIMIFFQVDLGQIVKLWRF